MGQTRNDQEIVAIEAPDRYLAITWQVNNFCNYSCSYCNPGNYSGENTNDGNLDLYLENLNEIVSRYKMEGYSYFKYFFSGGEPTAWRNFVPICEWIRKTQPDATIAVNTNLSRPLTWWKKHIHLFDDIVASFHVEFSDKEKYKEKSIWLCDKVNYLSSKMLMHEDRFWEIVEFGKSLKEVMPNYVLEWTPLYDELSNNAGPWQYNDVEKETFLQTHNVEMNFTVTKPYKENRCVSNVRYKDNSTSHCNSNEVIVNGKNFFRGWDCDVGDGIFINPTGIISMASCGATKNIGHILSDIDSVGPLTITCPNYHCYCGTDIIIPKRKTENLIELQTIE
jgi:organic radical activating enzyme